MFKALDAQYGREIIILDQSPGLGLDSLREKARANMLCCPICKQPVSVKAGELRRQHFAHKDLGNCPSSHEAAELLHARAVLYEWLKTKFNEGVTLEKRVEGLELPRSIDCWVDRPNGTKLAYWIVHARVPPADRETLLQGLAKGEIRGNFVFLSTMMQRNDKKQHVLNLRTTERELMVRSEIDGIFNSTGRSLHYLDTADHQLITLRGMRCIESPQQFQGHEITSAMPSVQVRRNNGEFVHPGEWDRLVEWKAELEREEHRAREAARLAEESRRRENEARQRAEAQAIVEAQRRAAADLKQQTQAPVPAPLESIAPVSQADPFAWKPKAVSSVAEAREGTCVFCGQRTTNWWTLNPDGTCKCRSCQAAGRT